MTDTEKTVVPPTVTVAESIGENKFAKLGVAAGAAVIACFAANKFSNGKLIPSLVGGLAGFVGAYKLAPEAIEDVQRAWEYGNQQKLEGKNVSLLDRFKYTLANFGDLSGQKYSATVDSDFYMTD